MCRARWCIFFHAVYCTSTFLLIITGIYPFFYKDFFNFTERSEWTEKCLLSDSGELMKDLARFNTCTSIYMSVRHYNKEKLHSYWFQLLNTWQKQMHFHLWKRVTLDVLYKICAFLSCASSSSFLRASNFILSPNGARAKLTRLATAYRHRINRDYHAWQRDEWHFL